MPNTIDFATVSPLLFYDFGLIADMIISPSSNPFVSLYFNTADDSTMLKALLLLLFAPWLLRIGFLIVGRDSAPRTQEHASSIAKPWLITFYLFSTVTVVALASWGYAQFLQDSSIWIARANIESELGASVIILYLPIYILTFYIRQSNSHTRLGLIFSLCLALACIISTTPIGERTNIILPLIMIALFRHKISIKRVILVSLAIVLFASVLLPWFKWQYSGETYSVKELITHTIQSDFSRSAVLISSLDMAEPVGTTIMPYPMSGYVYSLLFFFPRQLAPIKGYSTAKYFTSKISGERAEDLSWGFGVGAIEEIMLNIGFLLCAPGLIVYGLFLGLLNRASLRVPSLVVPTRLGSLLLFGYHLSSLLLTFGTMFIIGILLHSLFAEKRLICNHKTPISNSEGWLVGEKKGVAI